MRGRIPEFRGSDVSRRIRIAFSLCCCTFNRLSLFRERTAASYLAFHDHCMMTHARIPSRAVGRNASVSSHLRFRDTSQREMHREYRIINRVRVEADSVASSGSRVLTTGNRGHIPAVLPKTRCPSGRSHRAISLSHGRPPLLSRRDTKSCV